MRQGHGRRDYRRTITRTGRDSTLYTILPDIHNLVKVLAMVKKVSVGIPATLDIHREIVTMNFPFFAAQHRGPGEDGFTFFAECIGILMPLIIIISRVQ
jgi:hypothetical protein